MQSIRRFSLAVRSSHKKAKRISKSKQKVVIFGQNRGVAQPGRASALGAECRQFESGYPDIKRDPLWVSFFLYLRARSNCEVSSAKTPLNEVKAKAFLSLCASISPKGEMERSEISQSGYPDTQKDPPLGGFRVLRGQIELRSLFGKNADERSESKRHPAQAPSAFWNRKLYTH